MFLRFNMENPPPVGAGALEKSVELFDKIVLLGFKVEKADHLIAFIVSVEYLLKVWMGKVGKVFRRDRKAMQETVHEAFRFRTRAFFKV